MSNIFFFIIPVCSGMKGLAKDLKDQFIGMNIKQKGFLVHANDVGNAKRFNALNDNLSKGIIKSYYVIINGKNFWDQGIDSNIKRYEEICKLTTG